MSNTYPDLDRTTFPDAIDSRYVMIDPSTPSDITVIQSFQSAMNNKQFAEAESILDANPRLQRMVFNAAKWDRHEDMIIAIQRMWESNIAVYLNKVIEIAGSGPGGIIFPDGESLLDKVDNWGSDVRAEIMQAKEDVERQIADFRREIDCGSFTDDPEIAAHNASAFAHPFMSVDGNVDGTSAADSLQAHVTDQYAHPNLTVDGNTMQGGY